MQTELIDRAMQACFRQLEIRTIERFRCKEPLATELSRQLRNAVPFWCADDARAQLLSFSKELKNWIHARRPLLDKRLGPSILSPTPNSVNKPQPYFTEAVFATLIRAEVIATYARYLKALDIACLLGGSLSYGKFFNVRQSLTAEVSHQSDIDILLIADIDKLAGHFAATSQWNDIVNITLNHRASGNTEILDSPSALVLGLKPLVDVGTRVIKESRLDKDRTVITKKFRTNLTFEAGRIFYPRIKSFPFLLSVHIVSPKLYEDLTSPWERDEYIISGGGETCNITDIRIDSPIRDVMVYGTMEGTTVPESVAIVEKFHRSHDFGYGRSEVVLCKLPMYLYWEDRYVSGIYQNLIIPAFEVVCDNRAKTVERGITNFKHFLTSECLREKAKFLDSNLSLSKLHPRYPIFLKGTVDSFDRLTDKAITSKTADIISSYRVQQRLDVRRQFHKKYGSQFDLSREVRKEIAYYFGSDMSHLDILELGSGDGDFLMGLQREGHKGELCGIDLVPVPVKHDSIDFIVGDINHLPQLLISSGKRDKKFDIIVAIHVLYHIDNVPLLLESVTQWLRDGGVFITTANSNQNLHRISRLFRDALLKIGYSFTPDRRYSSFSADNATETMREYFRFVRHTITETDITITDRQDILDYLESNYENYEIPQSSEIRDRLRAYIRDGLENSDKFELIDRRIVSISSGREVIRYDSQA